MAITLAEIPLFADVELERLEKKIDDRLSREFSAAEPPNSVTVALWDGGMSIITPFHREMVARLISRYKEAGWKARWIDGNDRRPGPVTFFPSLILAPGDQTQTSRYVEPADSEAG